MKESIDELDDYLARCRADYYLQLQPGVSDQHLAAVEARLGLALPPTFCLLYKWRNGQRPECSASLVKNWMFSALEEVVETKELLDDMIGTDFEVPTWWSRGWIPFMSNGGGDYLCLDVAGEFHAPAGQLVSFWHDWEDRSTRYANVQEFVQAVSKSSTFDRQ